MFQPFKKTALFAASVILILLCNSSAVAAIRCVNHAATGANNGSSWANAYTRLQDALAVVASGDQIWVAAGTYKPSSTGDRTQSFNVPSGLGLYGGFAGTESSLTERNPATNPTILSGDLQGNDNGNRGRTEPTRLDNTYNVVRVSGASSTVTFDALTVQSGHSETYGDTHGSGAGIHFLASTAGTVVINNCLIRWNTARVGGGWWDDSNHVFTVSSTQLIQNQTERGGAAGIAGAFTIKNCAFVQNRTENSRDGYQWGGGLFIANGTGQIINCLFASNYAAEAGGAIFHNGGNTDIVNCTFQGNSAGVTGQTLHNYNSLNFRVSNCIIWGSSGGGSVIGNDNYGFSGTYTQVRNSLVQGGYTGSGTVNVISSDPIFINSTSPLGADGLLGTPDDGLRFGAGSPAINAGSNAYVPVGVTGDISGGTRILEATVDMGAYEGANVVVGPTINAHPIAATIKVTETVSFSVSAEGLGTLNYQWRKDGDDIPLANGATLNLASVNKLNEGAYDVVVTDDNDSVTSDAAMLTVISPAVFTDPTSRAGYAGQSTTFNVLAAGTGTVTYQWRKSGVNIPTATSSSLTLSLLNYRSAAEYDVVVTDDFDSDTSESAELTVLSPAPNVAISPGDTTVALGGNLTFTATVVTGIPPSTYQWRKNNVLIAKATNPTLVLTNIQRTQEGIYDVAVKNAFGVDVSNTARLSLPPLIAVTANPIDTAVNPGQPATFTVNVPGATAWQWLKNGVAIKNATTSTLTVLNTDANSPGLFSVTVTTPAGKLTTPAAQLIVNDSGLLIYKLTGTGTAYEGTVSTVAALSGYLVLDRAGQRGGLILGSKRGSQSIHSLEVHENLHTQSTGPVPKTQTVVSEMVADEFVLWVNGADSLLTIQKTLSRTDLAVGPATLKGYANSLDIGPKVRIETVSLTLALDAINSIPARQNAETVEQAMSRLSQDMQLKGSALVE